MFGIVYASPLDCNFALCGICGTQPICPNTSILGSGFWNLVHARESISPVAPCSIKICFNVASSIKYSQYTAAMLTFVISQRTRSLWCYLASLRGHFPPSCGVRWWTTLHQTSGLLLSFPEQRTPSRSLCAPAWVLHYV